MTSDQSPESVTFTPIIDVLAKELGLTLAAVYGVVRRHCQMYRGKCDASHRTLGEKIGVNHTTVTRSIKKLCELGYLEDLTTDRLQAVHIYIDTGDGKISALLDNKTGAPRTSLGELDNKTGAPRTRTGAPRTSLGESGAQCTIRYNKKQEDTLREADYLETVINHQAGKESIAEPDDFQKHFGYRDQFLKTYNRLTGETIAPAIKEAIVSLSEEESANPAIWEKSIVETFSNWTGQRRLPPFSRIVEVYRLGGNYGEWSRQKYGDNGTSKEEKVVLR